MFNISYFNLDLLSVGLAVAAMGVLGFIVFFNNKRSYTGRAFLVFCLTGVLWSILNYVSYKISDPGLAIWMIRSVIFSATWLVFSLFLLLQIFPEEKVELSRVVKFFFFPASLLVSALTLTPLVFEKIDRFSSMGTPEVVKNGPVIPLFGLYVLGLTVYSLYKFLIKTLRSGGQRKGFLTVLLGIAITFFLLIIFNFVLPAFFENSRFVPLGAVFLFPFVGFVAFAIFKRRLLDVKVVSTEILVFILAIVSLFEVVLSDSFSLATFRFVVFSLILSVGILLINSVVKEVRQREELERLSKELEKANEKLRQLDQARADFITIASHQLRTPPATIKWYLSAIKGGDYGNLPEEAQEAIIKAEATNNSLISLIDDLLNASRIERGKMEFNFVETDMAELVKLTVDQLQPLAKMKGLELTYEPPTEALPKIMADKEKLRQVVNNFIDNSIKYTKSGEVHAKLYKEKDTLRFQVTDTGKGIGKDLVDTLFEKYTRGKDSATHSTGLGLGLYVAKVIVEKHLGKIWAESEGEGKGSTFIFTVPVESHLSGTSSLDLSDKQMANMSDR